MLTVVMALTLVVAACSASTKTSDTGGTAKAQPKIDYKAIGLWNDGHCNSARPPLKIGMMTVFKSGVISLGDSVTALKAAAASFNARGGANGSCVEVHACDDGANLDQSLSCVRELDKAGVVATVNDQSLVGQAEISAAMAKARIPRVASLPTPGDWGDQNAYPIDAGGTGVAFMLPQALIDRGEKKIGIVRVDLAAAAALTTLLGGIYSDQGATFPVDLPVPAGTTDYTQFILRTQDAGAGGALLALGQQEAVQVVQAGQQLGTKLVLGSSLGTFSQADIAKLGDFAQQMAFAWSYPPATFNLPVYQALRDDLAASSQDALQPANLEADSMRSWIGLYALLRMMRDTHMTTFTRAGISTMLNKAKDVPMLGMFGGENWTPALNHPGIFKRAGVNYWASWKWDPKAKAPDGLTGNFVQVSTINFDKVLCGSPLGAKGPC